MAEIVGTFAVSASTTASVRLDTTGMTPDMIACYLLEDVRVDVSLCRQCNREVVAPEVGFLTGFTVDGVRYTQDVETALWVPVAVPTWHPQRREAFQDWCKKHEMVASACMYCADPSHVEDARAFLHESDVDAR